MTTISEPYSIIIPIDVLLETHIGTAALIDNDSPMDIIDNGYFKRDSNDLWEYTDKFTKTEFQDKWNNRDINTLKISVIRNILEFLKKMIQVKLAESTDRGGNLDINVIINSFPYTINNKLGKYLCAMMNHFLCTLAEIKIVDLAMDELTISYLKSNNVYVFFLNDFNDWIPLHYKELIEIPYPKLEIYAPMVVKDIKAKIGEAIESGKIDTKVVGEINPYRATELSFAKHLALNFLSVDFFSIPVL